MDTMLIGALEGFIGLLRQLFTNLLGNDAELWGNELKKFLRKEPCWLSPPANVVAGEIFTAVTTVKNDGKIITINRGCFNPAEFIGLGWSVIIEETDTRSTALTELDLTKVQQVTMLKDGETSVRGEEKLKRLKKSGNIRLDADIFFTLWQNQHLIPESWKEKVNGNIRCIFFDGTVLRSSNGGRCVLCLCWDGGKWHWRAYWLDVDWFASIPSAVLAS